MKQFEQETGKQSAIVKSFAGGQAIEDVDHYDLNDDGWIAESMHIADDKVAQRWKEEAIKMGNFVKTSDVFSE